MASFNPLLIMISLLLLILNDHISVATNIEYGEKGNTVRDNANSTNAPPPPPPPPPPPESRTAEFKPGIAVIVGILTSIFSITFLLLLYVKHCKRSTYAGATSGGGGYPAPARRNSGINRKVIESLPLFRFSSLRGQKDGLECAVCLNRFEADEVLRLLPKCKHAFHVECVDTWLDAHSTCPLCRYRVDPEDVLLVVDGGGGLLFNHVGGDQRLPTPPPPPPPRISGRHSSAGERGGSLEIIVENPRNDGDFRGRISLDSWKNSRRKTGKHVLRSKSLEKPGKCGGQPPENPGRRKDGQLPVQGDKRRLEHRIIVSGGGGGGEEGRRRWSDVAAADMLYLRSEMLIGVGGEVERSGRGVINERSVSEITGVSRYRSNNGERERLEEGAVRRWLAWISQSQQQQQNPAVHSATSSSSSSSIVV